MEKYEHNGYTIGVMKDGNVAVKTPCGKFFDSHGAQFADLTIEEYLDSQYEKPLQTLIDLAWCVQYSPDLLNRLRISILKHLVPRILSPVQHIHHNRLSVKSLNFWNPLTPWEDRETKFSRVCIDPASYKVFGHMLKYKSFPGESDNHFICAKFKKFVPEIEAALKDHPLVFSNRWESMTFDHTSEAQQRFTFLSRPAECIGNTERMNVPYRLLTEIGDHEVAPWSEPLLYALAVYIFSDFCRDRDGETEAFYTIAGDQSENILQAVWDHHIVPKDRFKEYEKDNPYTNQNEVSFDFAYPTLATQAPDFTLVVELNEFKYPPQRAAEMEKKRLKEKD